MSAGLYLHYPFCKQKCHYCDFVSTTDLTQRIGYLPLLFTEFELYQDDWKQEVFNSLYFGGGTPSLLPSEEWDLFAQWKAKELPNVKELTIEANPESINKPFLFHILQTGCNRISIGIQSMEDQVLSLAGRIHNSKQAKLALELAKTSGIKQISLDFIVGLPGESWGSIQQNCQLIQTFRPDHLSLYFLSLSPSTELFQRQQTDPSFFPEEKMVVEWWTYYLAFLKDLGYQHYEISNFALPGCESIHNQHYWDRDSYLGLGVNASSFLHERRWTNEPFFERYRQKVLRRTKPVYSEEVLKEETIRFERIMLGFRRFSVGIAENDISSEKSEKIQELLSQNWLYKKNTRLYLTEKGGLWLDAIIQKLT